ncbi:hypothetical protein [Novilysobacter erysipheiresistens]|uniref:Terminase small subunit n=1 Tax=Novilysobacter erysipheiresistens TaxID=1749332 RepID=A0ABU7YW00_9GAMM
MDDRVKKLMTPEQCEVFARNAIKLGRSDLAAQAKQRAVELRAGAHGAGSAAERECLAAIYAYEEILRAKHGRRVPARRTWQMIERRGIIPAIEHAVDRPDGTAGFTALQEIGLENYAFEAVVLRHPQLFSESAVERSSQRMVSLDEVAAIEVSGLEKPAV